MRSPFWPLRLQYRFWGEMTREFFPFYSSYVYARETTLPDQWAEDVHDRILTYCMGGEL